jgi:hypothetical protein
MEHLAVVNLKLNSDHYFENLSKFTRIYNWLSDLEIQYKLYYVGKNDHIPHSAILKECAATALKLKFAL